MSIICEGWTPGFAADTRDNFHLFFIVDISVLQLRAPRANPADLSTVIVGDSASQWVPFDSAQKR